MKFILKILLVVLLAFSLIGCEGNYGRVDLQKPIALGDDGVVEKEIFERLRDENGIAVFFGNSGGLKYEWTVFGSSLGDISESVCLKVELERTEDGVSVSFAQGKSLGFTAMLSIHLGEGWRSNNAVAYRDGVAIASVSVTGGSSAILNLPVTADVGDCIIKPASDKTVSSNATGRPSSDGTSTEQDEYLTDPVPEGKPLPVEPDDQTVDKSKAYTCIFSIECSTILNNLADLDPDKLELIPPNGVILPPTEVTFYEGESVFHVLQRVCREYGIHLESSWTPIYNSAYIEGIHNLYEFDCGELSGWTYCVDGWYPNYGCSRYELTDGETVEWRYTCELGKDVGCEWMEG